MAVVLIPPQLRKFTDGARRVEVEGRTLRQVLEALERLHPGIYDRVVEDGGIRPGIQPAIDSIVTSRGLLAPVGEASEVTFIPSISGGSPSARVPRR